MKLVLIIIGVGFLILSAIFAGGYYWFNKNKAEYAQLLTEYRQRGEAYGSGKLQSNCMNGLLQNMESCDGRIGCQFASVGFIRGCMTVAANDNYCDRVPRRNEVLKAVSWGIASCQNQTMDNDNCQRYIRGFVELCENLRASQPPVDAEAAKQKSNAQSEVEKENSDHRGRTSD